jgi:tripartite-type tricarboxylate transporter receptor subunit TctC
VLDFSLKNICRFAGLSMAVSLVSATSASADTVADFYHGQRVTLLVGANTGGGYDSFARPVSRNLGRFIPGSPSIVIRYMPGAALIAANTLYSIGTFDGLTIGAVQRQIPFEPLLGEKQARYDPRRMTWLGSLNAEVGVTIVWHTAPHQSMKDVFTTPLIVASLGTGTDADIETGAMNRMLGTKYKLISGYDGTSQALLAMERGEVQGVHGISWNYIRQQRSGWLQDKSARILLQTSLKPAPDLKDVPTIYDFIKTDHDRQIWNLILAQKEIARPYVLPPGVPADRAQALQKAMDEMVKDPQFLADIAKSNAEINYTPGPEMQEIISNVYSASPAMVNEWKEAIGRK